MSPYKALYGRRCRTPLCWVDPGESIALGPEVVQQTTEKVQLIQERMRAAQSRQKSYYDRRGDCYPPLVSFSTFTCLHSYSSWAGFFR